MPSWEDQLQRSADPAVRWLWRRGSASVRYWLLTDLAGVSPSAPPACALRAQVTRTAWVRQLLKGQEVDGGFGKHPYSKWTGAHWRLVSLVELAVPEREPRAVAAAETVLHWLSGDEHRASIPVVAGRARVHASQEGNALAACARLGLAGDGRVRLLADSLLDWQWPDGGWNCDRRPAASHSSFHESLAPLWGLIEFHRATGERAYQAAAQRAAELFLEHRLFRATRTGRIIHSAWLQPRYPPYWHYDILQGLLVLSRLGPLTDPRCAEALDVVESSRRPDGTWAAHHWYWHPSRRTGPSTEAAAWDRTGPNRMLTLNALRVLNSAGRLDI